MKMLVTVEGTQYEVDVEILDDGGAPAAPVTSAAPRAAAPVAAPAAAPPSRAPKPAAASGGASQIEAPLAGTVLRILVKVGDPIKANDPVVVLEAMKMESNISASAGGTVAEVCVKEGESVQPGKVLIKLS